MMNQRVGKLLFLLIIVLLLSGVGNWIGHQLNIQVWPHSAQQIDVAITILFLAYVVCMILPFMPAIELGLILLMMLDIKGIIFLYSLTIIALSISFWLGRLVPIRWLLGLFDFLHFDRASKLFNEMSQSDDKKRLDILIYNAPKRIIPVMLKHRYWVVAIALNMPGNALIGGGGGIGMISGMSRILNYPSYFLTVLIAVIPLPLIMIFKQLV